LLPCTNSDALLRWVAEHIQRCANATVQTDDAVAVCALSAAAAATPCADTYRCCQTTCTGAAHELLFTKTVLLLLQLLSLLLPPPLQQLLLLPPSCAHPHPQNCRRATCLPFSV
jgi:hypothetical protein